MKKETLKEIQTLCKDKEINQIKKLICGKLIGKGLYRDVYLLKQDSSYVVKIERNMNTGSFANVLEWRNYVDSKDWDYLKDWLAPIELINQTGQLMIQKKVTLEGKTKEDFPKRIPSLFTDLKRTNFGWINDQFVCCDYSFFLATCPRMKIAKWWGELK